MQQLDAQKILLIGAGALARDIVNVVGPEFFIGTFVDPGFATTPVQGLPVISDWQEAARCATHYAIGVLDGKHRRMARQQALDAGLSPCAPIVHATAQIAKDAKIGPGCLVGYYSVIGSGTELQEDVLVMFSANIGHDTVIGENSVILHGACISGYTTIGKDCFIGTNASLAPKITIGSNSFVAAGASCFLDAPPESMLIGNPARQTRHIP